MQKHILKSDDAFALGVCDGSAHDDRRVFEAHKTLCLKSFERHEFAGADCVTFSSPGKCVFQSKSGKAAARDAQKKTHKGVRFHSAHVWVESAYRAKCLFYNIFGRSARRSSPRSTYFIAFQLWPQKRGSPKVRIL